MAIRIAPKPPAGMVYAERPKPIIDLGSPKNPEIVRGPIGFDKTAYQREYMRKRRAAMKAAR